MQNAQVTEVYLGILWLTMMAKTERREISNPLAQLRHGVLPRPGPRQHNAALIQGLGTPNLFQDFLGNGRLTFLVVGPG